MIADSEVFHPLIRSIKSSDVDSVMEIETSVYPFPWTRAIFEECIKIGYTCNGLFLGQSMVGYCFQNQAAGESHLLNLCIHPDWQRRGYGQILLENAISRAGKQGAKVMFLEVRPSNPVAGQMYAKRGFVEIGRRPAYYRSAEGREDAVVMKLDI